MSESLQMLRQVKGTSFDFEELRSSSEVFVKESGNLLEIQQIML